MFKNLMVIEVTPVALKDREAFCLSYLNQRVQESLANTAPKKPKVDIIELNIPCGEGDTRPLVRYLRMLAFYINALVVSSKNTKGDVHDGSGGVITVSVLFTGNITTVASDDGHGTQVIQLKSGSFKNLYAIEPSVSELRKLHPDLKLHAELMQILDFYFAKTLAPAIILSHDRQLIHDLVEILAKSNGVHGISNIDRAGYKMIKSLYDPSDTPNLRDDILQIIHSEEGASVAVELACRSKDAQLQIREIIEDMPSMTAFSTERSALHKDGLLFGVFVHGEITPEIESRASLVI